MDAACWESWGEGIETPYSTGSSWRLLSIAYLLSLLLSFWFTFISLPVIILLNTRGHHGTIHFGIFLLLFLLCIWQHVTRELLTIMARLVEMGGTMKYFGELRGWPQNFWRFTWRQWKKIELLYFKYCMSILWSNRNGGPIMYLMVGREFFYHHETFQIIIIKTPLITSFNWSW